MARTDYTKERVALFTEFFLKGGKATVKKLARLFEDYSGTPPKRQTIYDDIYAISIVFPLGRVRDPKTHEYIWYIERRIPYGE